MTHRAESAEIQTAQKAAEPEKAAKLGEGIWFDPSKRSPDLTVGGAPKDDQIRFDQKSPDLTPGGGPRHDPHELETLDRQARKGDGYAAGYTLNAMQEEYSSNPKEFEARLGQLRDKAATKNAEDKSLPQIHIAFGHPHANDGTEDPNLLQVQIQYQQDSKHTFSQILVNETIAESTLQPISPPEYHNAKRFN